jgi:hypothetical protein
MVISVPCWNGIQMRFHGKHVLAENNFYRQQVNFD